MSKRAIVVLSVVWLILLVSGLSVSLTLSFCGMGGLWSLDTFAQELDTVTVSREQAELIERYERLEQVYQLVKDDYYLDTDDEKLLTGAVDGMLASLEDPYTFYYTPEEMASQNQFASGEYEGIGIQISLAEEGLVITRVFRNSPAHKAGLRSGDVLTGVNGETLTATTVEEMEAATKKIRAAGGDTIRLNVRRAGVTLGFDLTRTTVTINRVEYAMLEDHVGYILIYEFQGNDVEGFNEALDALLADGMTSLVLDLRSNPGGLLSDVIAIGDRLLPEGLFVYIEDREGRRENFYLTEGALDLPLAVLVNGHSASAAELLAGAIQDAGAGEIVGETTFGKGIVQTILSYPSDGAGVQLTTSTYFTPKGRMIHGTGIVPDHWAALDASYDPSLHDPSPEDDAQLAKALEVLRDIR